MRVQNGTAFQVDARGADIGVGLCANSNRIARENERQNQHEMGEAIFHSRFSGVMILLRARGR